MINKIVKDISNAGTPSNQQQSAGMYKVNNIMSIRYSIKGFGYFSLRNINILKSFFIQYNS